jgi:hypothetical protein
MQVAIDSPGISGLTMSVGRLRISCHRLFYIMGVGAVATLILC